MVSKLQNLLNLTFKTFYSNNGNINGNVTPSHFQELFNYFNKINLHDEIDLSFINEGNKLLNEFSKLNNNNNNQQGSMLNFLREKINHYDRSKFENISIYVQSKSPILHMHVFEKSSCASLAVFLIRKGFKIPLHNHPNMYGLIKVLHGHGTINSYTLNETKNTTDNEIIATNECTRSLIIGDMLKLEPNLGNVHEISASSDSDLAFIDLIVPPYESNCSYYEILKKNDNLVYLKVLNETPADYYCDSLVYHGPKLRI